MYKTNKGMTRSKIYSESQKSKHRYDTNYIKYISFLTPLQKNKLSMLCTKRNVEPHDLRDKEFAMVTINKVITKFFRRARKHKKLYDSYFLVLTSKT